MVPLDRWKRLRAIVAPTFATGKLRRMKPLIDSICQTLILNIDNHQEETKCSVFNIRHFIGCFTMDTILQVAFGVKINSLVEPNNELVKTVVKLFNQDMKLKDIIAFMIILYSPRLQKIFRNLRPNAAQVDFFEKYAREIIVQKRKQYEQEKGFSKASNFIEFLLEAENEYAAIQRKQMQNSEPNNDNGKPIKYISEDEMIAQCILFFFGGFHPTTIMIMLACYRLALNPDKEKLAYEEVCRVASRYDNVLESIPFESLGSEFEYICAVIDESLRMTPVQVIIERLCEHDCVLTTEDGRYNVPVKKDEIVQIPVYALHYNDEYFPQPEQFRPERFCKKTADNFPNYAYLPFGSGPRVCVAKSLALLEAKMALIWLIKNFHMTKCPIRTKDPLDFNYQAGMLVPKDIALKFERRQKN